MSIWYGILWIISVMMGCWSFSLFVRLVSESVARKRKRLVSQRTNRSFWLAIMLMFISAAAAVLGALMALYIERQYGSGSGWVSTVGFIGGSFGLFAICLIIWAVVGDHSRGRVRCPKCWYDMSAATGLLCPECGHTVKNVKQFKKSRRPRWAFVLAVMLLGLGGVGVGLNDRVRHRGYLAIMPDWMMLMGWESYPDHWVYDTGASRQDSSLAERIGDRLISRDASHELAEELFDRMIEDQDERWSPKNHALLAAVFRADNRTRYRYHENFDEAWLPSGDKLKQLFVASADDILDAILSESPSSIETQILTNQSQWFNDDAYELCSSWTTEASVGGHRYFRYGRRLFYNTENIRGLLSGLKAESSEIDLIQLIRDDEQQRLKRAIRLLTDTGAIVTYIDQYIEAGLSVDGEQREDVLLCHALAITMLADERRIAELDTLAEMMREGNAAERGYALGLMVPLSRVSPKDPPAVVQARRTLVRSAYELAVTLRNGVYSVEARDLLNAAIEAVTAYDEGGRYSFEIVSESFENNGKEPGSMDGYQFYMYDETDERIHNWVESFWGLELSSSFTVRMWLVENFPESVDSPDDDRLEEMLLILSKDEDPDISGKAEVLQYQREDFKERP